MKILLGFLGFLVIAASLIIDYRWRQWMAARKRDRHWSHTEKDRDR